MSYNYDNLRSRLALLSKKDRAFSIFGAATHKYRLRPRLSEIEIKNFERHFGIQLPEEYRGFLLHMGNGGAGPFYGIEKLEDSIYDDLDYKNKDDLIDPSQEFPFTEAWNLGFSGEEDID